ncbi:MAG: hypothetical protein AAGD11_16800 [Planctomycetota bacterium]
MIEQVVSSQSSNDGSESEPIGERRSSRRLRVSHFLLVTTLCAIVLAVRDAWFDWKSVAGQVETYAYAYLTFSSLLYGVALSGLCVFVWHRVCSDVPSVKFAGHWMLLFAAIGVILDALVSVSVWLYSEVTTSSYPDFYAWNLDKILLCSAMACNCATFAWLISGDWCWKLALIFPAAVLVMLVPQHIYVFAMNGMWREWFATSHAYAQLVTTAVVGCFVVAAVWKEWGQRRDFDWLHWSGVVLTLLYVVGGFLSAMAWLHYYA